MRRFVIVAAIGAALGGCVQEARIRVPSDFEVTTERLELVGMGGWRTGTFRLGELGGSFTRDASRLALFDRTFVKQYGGASFTLDQGQPLGSLMGQCGFSQSSVNLGPLTGRSRPLTYRCEFTVGGRKVGFLEVRDRDGFLGSPDGKDARVGFGELNGVPFNVRSLHLSSASPIPLPTPLGYAIEHDGRQVGAVDLNGPAKTLFLPREGQLRDAALAAGLALSVFWDPAEVGDDQ